MPYCFRTNMKAGSNNSSKPTHQSWEEGCIGLSQHWKPARWDGVGLGFYAHPVPNLIKPMKLGLSRPCSKAHAALTSGGVRWGLLMWLRGLQRGLASPLFPTLSYFWKKSPQISSLDYKISLSSTLKPFSFCILDDFAGAIKIPKAGLILEILFYLGKLWN